jgi:hypothetical protein
VNASFHKQLLGAEDASKAKKTELLQDLKTALVASKHPYSILYILPRPVPNDLESFILYPEETSRVVHNISSVGKRIREELAKAEPAEIPGGESAAELCKIYGELNRLGSKPEIADIVAKRHMANMGEALDWAIRREAWQNMPGILCKIHQYLRVLRTRLSRETNNERARVLAASLGKHFEDRSNLQELLNTAERREQSLNVQYERCESGVARLSAIVSTICECLTEDRACGWSGSC